MAELPQIDRLFHTRSVEDSLSILQSRAEGLSEEEAKQRLEHYGTNELPKAGKQGPFGILLRQVKSLMVYVLLAAAGLSALFAHWLDAGVIIGIVIINAIIGFFQEYRAEKALEALSKLLVLKAKVLRGGHTVMLSAGQIVPGDIVLLEDGDKVPADGRIISERNFQTSEASLTGEAFPIDKNIENLAESTSLADRANMVWMGTLVARGTATVVITHTGAHTAMGDIAKELAKIETQPGHFEKRMRRLTQQMGALAIGAAVVTFLVGVFIRQFPVAEMLIFATAALVSGIPEGLPVVLVIILAVGSHRMSKRNAIVRQLSAIETLGAVTVIVTDKTGTLTQNKMTVQAVSLPGQEPIYAENNESFIDNLRQRSHDDESFRYLLNAAAVNNSARMIDDESGESHLSGDPTETSLIEFADELGLEFGTAAIRYDKIDDLGFVQEKRWRACLTQQKDDPHNKVILVSGAPEAVLAVCTHVSASGQTQVLDEGYRNHLHKNFSQLTDRAMRVIGLAYRIDDPDAQQINELAVNNLTFLGAVGIIDPPRPEVREAIVNARRAGIRVVMATGDHPSTAVAIGRQIGLIEEGQESKTYNGGDLANASDAEFDKVAADALICARFTPNVKLKLAAALQRAGQIVAMTGDGVNDAPALKQADVGISMAITGTEVARESSEIVLADDNFASILNAIEEGRTQFRNARRSTLFLVTTNAAESVAILVTIFMGLPLPLLATQILWMNLVTDGVTVFALAVEPTHEDVLNAPPRDPKEQILTRSMLPFIIINAVIMVALTVAVFVFYLDMGLDRARTAAFVVLSWTQLFNVLNMRSLKNSLFQVGLFSNPAIIWALAVSVALLIAVVELPILSDVFSFVSLGAGEMLVLMAVSSLVFWAIELYKFIARRTGHTSIA